MSSPHPRWDALVGRCTAARERAHAREPARTLWRCGVFALGLLCVVVGVALIPLPGPLTIPPMLLGLRIWASEFGWARRRYDALRRRVRQARKKVRDAREHRAERRDHEDES